MHIVKYIFLCNPCVIFSSTSCRSGLSVADFTWKWWYRNTGWSTECHSDLQWELCGGGQCACLLWWPPMGSPAGRLPAEQSYAGPCLRFWDRRSMWLDTHSGPGAAVETCRHRQQFGHGKDGAAPRSHTAEGLRWSLHAPRVGQRHDWGTSSHFADLSTLSQSEDQVLLPLPLLHVWRWSGHTHSAGEAT